MELVKNNDYEIKIEDMGNDGEGIGHIDGMTVFVKDTVMEDVALIKIIKLKKNIVYGRLVKLIKPSPYRVLPACSKARQCGGCSMQHINYEKQLSYKWNKIANC
ncbi:MAG: TRAM domain-containing protein, partial [Coprococcus sp.]